VLGVVAERRHTTYPQALALGGADLIADALAGTSRANWAKDSSTFNVSLLVELVALTAG
jgi:hypothetical protein